MVSPQEDLMRRIMSEVTEKLTGDLRNVLAQTIERQLSEALTQSLLESEFYRRISRDMRTGLKRIYREINAAATPGPAGSTDVIMNKEQADKLFHEASEQLNAVLVQTEKATEDIMEVVERHMEVQVKMEEMLRKAQGAPLSPQEMAWLDLTNSQAGEDLNNVLMSLSFQDLTGQRIKRAVKALQEIESTVVELYLSTGLLIQAYEAEPDKDLDRLESETRNTVNVLKGSVLDSSLKGPGGEATQQNIDDLLAQLGMD